MKGMAWGLVLFLCFQVTEPISIKKASERQSVAYTYTSQYEFIWDNKGCNSKHDVSIWRPISFPKGFYPLGDTAVAVQAPPHHSALLVQDMGDGLVKPPHSFRKIWTDKGSSADRPVTIYRMIPPKNYTCLGHVAVRSYRKSPSADLYRCVQSNLVTAGVLSLIWRGKHLGTEEDTSLWHIESNSSLSSGLSTGSFLCAAGKQPPSDFPYLLDNQKANFSELNADSQDIALILFETKNTERVWDNHGTEATKEISIWRGQGCCSLGDIAVAGYTQPPGAVLRAKRPGALAAPFDYIHVWSRICPKGRDIAIWLPMCPEGYASLGHVVTDNPNKKPSHDIVRCVNESYTAPGTWAKVWDSKGTKGKESVSLWRADAQDSFGKGVYAMSSVKGYGPIDLPALVLNRSYVKIYTSDNDNPTKKVVIYDIEYDFNKKEVLSTDPQRVSSKNKVENCAAASGSPPLKVERQLPFTVESESSWKFDSDAIENGIPGKIHTGIPDVAEGIVTQSLSKKFTTGAPIRHVETQSDYRNARVTVNAGFSLKFYVSGLHSTVRVPWRGLMELTFQDGTYLIQTVTGEYTGVQISELTVSTDDPQEC
ncbi:uncharacterized protein LOC115073812 isoform X2 [Rhinatrema bivittatum]|uniref:uncharacterized protein LOC115073812 isoform X2 n=1 Tax=Rhinatrema bivittatum TaxID=194408 RepID=UPI00112D9DF2|nr:uncharacterized protein LOC115073812 isoform X2 [Rhinatrema bivittatum]